MTDQERTELIDNAIENAVAYLVRRYKDRIYKQTPKCRELTGKLVDQGASQQAVFEQVAAKLDHMVNHEIR